MAWVLKTPAPTQVVYREYPTSTVRIVEEPYVYCPPPRQTIAKQSPPIPVDIGSVTQSTAAAASAASAAFPPRSSIRSPACVASGWLVATIARPVTHGPRLTR